MKKYCLPLFDLSADSPALGQAAFVYKLRKFHDARGDLVVIEGERDVPFPVARVFTIHNVPVFALRGDHAHKALQQVVRAVAGSFVAVVDGEMRFTLCQIDEALYVGSGHHLVLRDFSVDGVAEVFCSQCYDEEDYIR